jgi:C1A family cysteine protease
MSTSTPHQIKGMGWRPDLPDIRDRILTLPHVRLGNIPRYINLSGGMPPVYDQGNAGSCTGNSTAAPIAYDRMKAGMPPFTPSRLMLYYDGRLIEGTQGTDAGASIRDVVKAAAATGVCDEALWPYNVSKVTSQPNAAAYANAAMHKVTSYSRLPSQDINTMAATLAQGLPFVFGFTVYQSFMTNQVARTGLVPMPQANERSVGGHAIVAVGKNSKNYIMFRNSWGEDWGDPDYPGYGWLPAAYITNPQLASDFWVIRTVAA